MPKKLHTNPSKFFWVDPRTINLRKLGCARKERATFILPILVCVVNNIQGTSIGGV